MAQPPYSQASSLLGLWGMAGPTIQLSGFVPSPYRRMTATSPAWAVEVLQVISARIKHEVAHVNRGL